MIQFSRTMLHAGLIVFAVAIAAPPFAASSGGGSSGGGGGGDPNAPVVCREGYAYSKEKKICVPKGELDDAMLFEQGNALALAGHYERALDVLGAVRNRRDANVLTMIGYSKRKMGALEEGIAIYHEALAIDPDNVNTREYLGEGYLTAGRIDLAEAELNAIGQICGHACIQYRTLEKAIAGAPGWN